MKILCLDLSTQSSGYAVFKNSKLESYGVIKPKVKGISSLKYPEGAYKRIIDMSNKIKDLISDVGPDIIVIEEVNRGISRISQKSLDALHFFVIDRIMLIDEKLVKKIVYIDSNGKTGWRGKLGLKLDDQDKEHNANARLFNKKNASAIKKGEKEKAEVIDWKDLSIRYVAKKFKLDLSRNKSGDADVADAICVGAAYLLNKKG